MFPEGAEPSPLTVASRHDSPALASTHGGRQTLIVSEWEGIRRRLQTVIGAAGMGALYHRAVFLTATTHPLLIPAIGEAGHVMDLSALAAALADHPDALVKEAGDALMQTFVKLLASLIGPALTQQLIQPLPVSDGRASTTPEPSP
jgi:hypothetical protein